MLMLMVHFYSVLPASCPLGFFQQPASAYYLMAKVTSLQFAFVLFELVNFLTRTALGVG